ncbi:MAG: undecaprenyldiphospho-muramoylpentapeptide beta-N-acetylglucosaminyltransferase [Deltaproteobacteria bacterium]|nr:MAG: undecaprenyldiphospho-muramoylpentapeptide beta-N-acetylglucosaminyltransferase [Deltaproteobacteria bacterium]
MKLVIAGGGTGGHLFPGIAVAEAWRQRAPAPEVAFVGTKGGIEARILPDSPFPLYTIEIGGIKGKSTVEKIRNILKIPASLWASLRLLGRLAPDVVLGVGGYASGPVVLAAWLRRIPCAIQEQNTHPGLTNRILAHFADRIFLAFEPEGSPFPPKKCIVTGNPIRQTLLSPPTAAQKEERGFTLLVFGGSQGARRINEAIIEILPQLAARGVRIIHQTGRTDYERVAQAYRDTGIPDGIATVTPFIDQMAQAYSTADLIVCRSGATTIAELTAIGRPAILVPYPHAAYDHQEKNARRLLEKGAARMILDRELTGKRLLDEILSLLESPETLRRISENAHSLGHPEAADAIVEALLPLAAQRQGITEGAAHEA